MLLWLGWSLEPINAPYPSPLGICMGKYRKLNLILFLLGKQIHQVNKRTRHCQTCQRNYVISKRHNGTLGGTRWGMQDTCFHCTGAQGPEVEMMIFRTWCEIQVLTQLFSAGVKKGHMIYCIYFVEVGNFLVCVAHPQDEMGLWKVRVYHCFQMMGSIL